MATIDEQFAGLLVDIGTLPDDRRRTELQEGLAFLRRKAARVTGGEPDLLQQNLAWLNTDAGREWIASEPHDFPGVIGAGLLTSDYEGEPVEVFIEDIPGFKVADYPDATERRRAFIKACRSGGLDVS